MLFSTKKVSKQLFFIAMVVSFTQATLISDKLVIIGFSNTPGKTEKALIKKIGGEIRYTYNILPAISAKVPKKGLEILQNSSLVKYIEEDKATISITQYSTDLSEYQSSWGIQHINSKKAHDRGITGKNVKVAILDTGIDYNHKDLKDNYRGGYNFIKNGKDSNDPLDDGWNAHGTHLAGIIAASANGVGVVGVAPDASIYAVKVLDGSGFGFASDIIAGIQWAVDNKMDIANISISGSSSNTLKLACDAGEEAGLLIIAAAGNTYGEPSAYPGTYKSVIAVTSVDKTNKLSFFSPIDSAVEIAAPGYDIKSTSRDNSYATLSGTSQSTAFVSGVAALIISSGINDVNGDGEINNLDIRKKLQTTALDLGEIGRDDKFGYGLVDANNAVAKPSTIYDTGFKQGKKDSRNWKTWSIPDNYENDDTYIKGYDDGWESFDRLNPPVNEGDYDIGFKQGKLDSCNWKTWSIPDNYLGNDLYVKAYDDGWESCDRTGATTDINNYDTGFKQGKLDSCSWKTWSIPDNYLDDTNYIKGYDYGWESCNRTGTN